MRKFQSRQEDSASTHSPLATLVRAEQLQFFGVGDWQALGGVTRAHQRQSLGWEGGLSFFTSFNGESIASIHRISGSSGRLPTRFEEVARAVPARTAREHVGVANDEQKALCSAQGDALGQTHAHAHARTEALVNLTSRGCSCMWYARVAMHMAMATETHLSVLSLDEPELVLAIAPHQ